ncbi:putative Mn2+ efflux pump MntP [Breznakia sp. PF5-3]|uniref:manganese efflux pump MntP n=1 Tax=unclassified Breznakia TaxID=2623764 RepID=UPI00240620B6|nr:MULTISPECIES: manganese efflux pump MntP family protein [unclassified Breznakia]MDL2276803.1 manganese efflux pump MntP family protein [Breznakia sp. OttesenSCG-928-G09]MDF9825074.1 putative Mn2+ efflux pump MntP [Breznakia sp. PM6-1]MDF9835949.1 putative Mn2+ efflux pump MntP [Breznakia sp. PF5-3]MDF9837449.1 putative Mn2+ efflux pump MntP [Breznakia sp. PFB2-8]MDF9859488.1 putative Mn2+ efflux pump MntP [Breznakia sp. PH5-24]
MDIITIILTGVGLAMDASAVSIAKGMCFKKEETKKYAFILAFTFGFSQALMPIIGYLCGTKFTSYIQSIDHWIAFILLFIIGIKMIKESLTMKEEKCDTSLTFKDIIVLGIATSIDALAVGVSFAFLNVNIIYASSIIGIVTFILSLFCVFMGKQLGTIFQKYAEIFGGSILVFLGIKILIEHLFL